MFFSSSKMTTVSILFFFVANCSGHMNSEAGAGIDPTTSHPARTLILSTGTPSSIRDRCIFHIYSRHKVEKCKNYKNPVAEQRSSQQGCIVRPQNQHWTQLVKGYLQPRIICPGCHLPSHTCDTVLSLNPPAGLHNAHGPP
jgi:hypothetical protein